MADDVARLVAVLEANIKGFTKGMDSAQKIADRRFGQIERRMQQSEKKFTAFGSGFTRLFAGALSIAGVTRFVSAIGDMAGKLQDTSESLGVTTNFLQTLGVLAGRAGVGQDQLNKSLSQFAARLGEAQIKGGPFKKFLDGIGVGTKGTTEEVFNRIADAVKNTSDQTQRAAIVAEAFTARGVKLTSVVQQGAAALKSQAAEFARIGLILTPDSIRKIDELGDKWADLKRQFTVIGANALVPLVDQLSKPEFLRGVQAFASGMSQVSVAIAKISPHVPALLAAGGMFAVTRSPLAAGAAFAVTEAFGERTLAQLEAALAANEAAAAASVAARPAALASIELIKKQIAVLKQARHDIATAAGIPLKGVPEAPPGGIDRSGTLETESGSKGKTVAEREAELTIENLHKLERAVQDIREQQVEDERRYQTEMFEAGRELRNKLGSEELQALDQFHEDAKAAWDSYYERLAEGDRSLYDGRLAAAQDFFGTLSNLAYSSNKELAAIGKAAAIVQATIDGVLAVQKALASAPPPFNFALAAAVGAVAAANVAEIAGMEHGGRVSAGTPYIVGEKRPELFVPDAPGRIIPRVPSAIAASSSASGSTIMIDARGAQIGVGEEIAKALGNAFPQWRGEVITEVQRGLPRMMTKAQRDNL